MQGSPAMSPAGPWAILRRRAWIVAVAALAAAFTGYLVASHRERTYQSSAVILVGPINAGIDTLRASGPLAETYAELATSRPVVAETERALHASGLRGRLRAHANQATRLLTIDARDPDPARAAQIANRHARSLLDLARERASGAIPSGRLRVVDPAVPDPSGVGPAVAPITVLAGLAGLAAALLLVLLADRSTATIADPAELELLTGVPCLATVGRAPLRRERGGVPVVEGAPRSRAAEEYRLLAAKLEAVGGRSIAVLSADGTTGGVVAANLAGALTARGARIALVDLDETLPNGHESIPEAGEHAASANGNGAGTGLALRRPEAAAVARAMRGGTDGARALLRELLADADIVVLHPPGGAGSPSGLIWARVAEATLLAVQRERTPRRDVANAVQSLRLVQARIAGAVLTPGSWWQ
jgi:capsular polysaccharide biosynthesis protein/Mrp family chromosome partitioning ATPase